MEQKYIKNERTGEAVAVLSSSSDFKSSFTDAFTEAHEPRANFSFTNPIQALLVLKTFPGHQRASIGSFVLLVVARIAIRLKHVSNALDERECLQAMKDQENHQGFRLYSVVLPERTVTISHRIESCDRSDGTLGKLKIAYNDGSNELPIIEDLLAESDYGLILELNQHPMAEKMHVNFELIRYSSAGPPEALVRKHGFSFDYKMDAAFSFKHGIGNIAAKEFAQPLTSIFEFFYHSLTLSDGGSTQSQVLDCEWDRTVQGDSLYAIDGIFGSTWMNPQTSAARPGPAVLCSDFNSQVGYSGCQMRVAVTGDSCMERSQTTGKCTMCSPGYFVKDEAECAECRSGCLRCQNGDSCEVCKLNFAKNSDESGQYVCVEATSGDSNIYLHQLQSVFNSSLLLSNSFSLDSRSIVIIEAEVMLEFVDDYRLDSYSFYDVSLLLDGLAKQTRQLTEPASNHTVVRLFQILIDLEPGEHKITALSSVASKLTQLRLATLPVKQDEACLVEVWGSNCHLCNSEAGFFLDRSLMCLKLGDSQFISENRPGIGDVLASCQDPQSTLRCTGGGESQALECKERFVLQATQSALSGGFKCIACSSSCRSCSSATTNCTLCSDGYFSLTMYDSQLQAFTTACLLRCPDGYFLSPQERICQKCPNNCLTCSPMSIIGCITCQTGYQLYQNEQHQQGICAEPCAISDCLYCLRPKVCGACQIGFQLEQESTRCERVPLQHVSIEANVDIQQRSLNLLFDPAVLPRDVKDCIKINFDPTQMELQDSCFNRTQPTSKCEFQMRIKQEDAVQNLKFEITIAFASNTTQGATISLTNQTIQLFVPYKGLSSVHNLEFLETGASVLGFVSQACALVSLFLEPHAFVSVVRSNQVLKILLAFSEALPSNTAEPLSRLSSGLLDQIYNPLRKFGSLDCSLPPEFEKVGMRCGLLQSAGQASIVVALLLFLKLLTAILHRQKCIRFKKILWLDNFLNARTFVDWTLILVDGFLLDMLLAALVNLKYFRSTRCFCSLLNLLLSILVIFLYFADFLVVYFAIYPKQLQALTNKLPPRKRVRFEFEGEGQTPVPFVPSVFGVPSKYLVSEPANKAAQSGNPAIVFQKSKAVLLACLAVLLLRWRLAQAVLLAAVQLSFALLFTIKMPHDTKKENFKTLSTEILLSVTMMLCVALVNTPTLIESAYDRYYYVGFALTSAVSSIFMLASSAWIYSSAQSLVRLWKAWRRKKEPRRGKLLRTTSSLKVQPTPLVRGTHPVKVLKLVNQLARDGTPLIGKAPLAPATVVEEAPVRPSHRLPVPLFDGRLFPAIHRESILA